MTSLQAQVAQLGSGTICNNAAQENNNNLILLQASPVSNGAGHVLNHHHHANPSSDNSGLSTHQNVIVSDQNHIQPHMNSYQVQPQSEHNLALDNT